MPSKVYSGAIVGVEAFEVEIEVRAGWGSADKIAVVGLPDAAVRESKDRVTTAICNSALRWPSGKRITINLAACGCPERGAKLRSADRTWNAKTGRGKSSAGSRELLHRW
jgi:magnesium chelatase family protein